MAVLKSIAELFWPRVDRRGPDECWEWTGPRSKAGYGEVVFERGGQYIRYTHRVAWSLTNGPIPGGLHVLHRCDNRPCCNPSHLFLGTNADNVADAIAKGRHHFVYDPRGRGHHVGIKNPSARFTENDVRQIRQMASDGVPSKVIAERFRTTASYVRDIKTRRTWSHLH